MVSIKDSITSGLPTPRSLEGMEVGGSSGHPATPQFKFTWDHAVEDVSTDDVGKNGTRATKSRKRGAVNVSNGNVWMEVEGLLDPW